MNCINLLIRVFSLLLRRIFLNHTPPPPKFSESHSSAELFCFVSDSFSVNSHNPLAAKDDVGTIRIQRPTKGPFYVSPKTIDELIANLGKWARWYKFASMGLTVFGVYLIANHSIRYIMERRHRNEIQKRVLAAAAKMSGQDNGGLGRVSCMATLMWSNDLKLSILDLRCGHMYCCTACSSHLTSCPLCRRQIERAVKTFRY